MTYQLFWNPEKNILHESEDILYSTLSEPGLNETVVRQISESFHEPKWMLEKRLESLKIYNSLSLPKWGPSLEKLDLDHIYYYAKPEWAKNSTSWEEVPESIKKTFDRLGIPEAEQKVLWGVWAQYDSDVVYHKLKDELVEKGVLFEDMSVAIKKYEHLIKPYFMKAVPTNDHKFAALHGAVWSGGTFLYIPKWVQVDSPIQAYFRMNARAWGQFEHTLIILEDNSQAQYIEGCSAPKYWTPSLHAWCVEIYVGKNASMRYSSVENWSPDTYNLNTKRAIIEANWKIEWIGWNLGAWVTMLYPCSILLGDNSSSYNYSIAFANKDQIIDAGSKIVHIWKNTKSEVVSKSLSKDWWKSIYRGLIDIKKNAHNALSTVDCDWLILDTLSISETIPDIRVKNSSANVAHEASVGNINPHTLFYLMSRGLSEEQAKTLLVRGFISPLIKELPLEYAAELNTLIALEIEWM